MQYRFHRNYRADFAFDSLIFFNLLKESSPHHGLQQHLFELVDNLRLVYSMTIISPRLTALFCFHAIFVTQNLVKAVSSGCSNSLLQHAVKTMNLFTSCWKHLHFITCYQARAVDYEDCLIHCQLLL